MKKHYQILYRGIYSNKLSIVDYSTMKDYMHGLKTINKCKNLQLIMTNIYEE